VARFATSRLTRAGAETSLLDLAEYNLPIMEERLYKRDDPPPGLERFSASVQQADAIVVVSPEYNASIPGVLKNALDYIYGEWFRKPIGLITVSAGGFGGVLVHSQLQLLFLRLKALPVAGMHVSNVWESFGEDGEPAEERYEKVFAGFVETLEWYARAIKAAQTLETD